MSTKWGVFIGRMQPVHNGHLFLIKKALEENDSVFVLLGSSNKSGTIRNSFDKALRVYLLRNAIDEEIGREGIDIDYLPDWTMENDKESDKIWGRYLYYNIVSRIGQKEFSLYYSDDVSILDRWFEGTEVRQHINYRCIGREHIFDGLSATKIRQALLDENKDYVERYCPNIVARNFGLLSKIYKEVVDNPKEDFEME